jgi:hypothetical protein
VHVEGSASGRRTERIVSVNVLSRGLKSSAPGRHLKHRRVDHVERQAGPFGSGVEGILELPSADAA